MITTLLTKPLQWFSTVPKKHTQLCKTAKSLYLIFGYWQPLPLALIGHQTPYIFYNYWQFLSIPTHCIPRVWFHVSIGDNPLSKLKATVKFTNPAKFKLSILPVYENFHNLSWKLITTVTWVQVLFNNDAYVLIPSSAT